MKPEDGPKKPTTRGIWHQSGVNSEGKPFVQITLDGELVGQITPAEAREMAFHVIAAAEASEQDAFIMSWVQASLGLSFEQAGAVLVDFRKFREESTGKKSGPKSMSDEYAMPPDWTTRTGKPKSD